MGGHIKQNLRFCVVIAEDGKCGIIGSAGLGGDPLGHFLLNHDGDRLEAFRLQQGTEDGRSNVVGQIGTGHGPQAGKLLCHQCLHIGFQHIIPDNLQIVKFSHGQLQNGL